MPTKTTTYPTDGPVTLRLNLGTGSVRVTVEDRPRAEVTVESGQQDDLDEVTVEPGDDREFRVRNPHTPSGGGGSSVSMISHGNRGSTIIQTGGNIGSMIGMVTGDMVVSGGDVIVNGQRVSTQPGQVVVVGAGTNGPVITARLPLGSALTAVTDLASVDVEHGELATVRYHSGAGSLRVTATPRLEAETTSGDIRAEAADTATIETTSGDINIGRTGSVHATSTSGDITVSDFGGDGYLKTISGDVRVHATEGGDITASSTSGDVTVTATTEVTNATNPDDRLNAQAHTVSGRTNTPTVYRPHGPRPRSPRT